MADTQKKYMSKINKNGEDIYIKDAEARAAIANMPGASVMTDAQARAIFSGYDFDADTTDSENSNNENS